MHLVKGEPLKPPSPKQCTCISLYVYVIGILSIFFQSVFPLSLNIYSFPNKVFKISRIILSDSTCSGSNFSKLGFLLICFEICSICFFISVKVLMFPLTRILWYRQLCIKNFDFNIPVNLIRVSISSFPLEKRENS